MEISELLQPEAVISGLKASGKKHALQELAPRESNGLVVVVLTSGFVFRAQCTHKEYLEDQTL